MLKVEIDKVHSGHTGSTVNGGTREYEGGAASSKEAALNDLLNEATLSLARILLKQGCVSAKFDNHHLALVRC